MLQRISFEQEISSGGSQAGNLSQSCSLIVSPNSCFIDEDPKGLTHLEDASTCVFWRKLGAPVIESIYDSMCTTIDVCSHMSVRRCTCTYTLRIGGAQNNVNLTRNLVAQLISLPISNKRTNEQTSKLLRLSPAPPQCQADKKRSCRGPAFDVYVYVYVYVYV